MALAMARRCFSPPDSLKPRSPTIVSYPWGIPMIYPALIASLAALVIVSLLTKKPKPEELEKFFPKGKV